MSARSCVVPSFVPAWLSESETLYRFKNGRRYLEIVTPQMRKEVKGLNAWFPVFDPHTKRTRRFSYQWEKFKDNMQGEGFWRCIGADDSELPFERTTKSTCAVIRCGGWEA